MTDFAIGNEVYVRSPQRYSKDCTCIVGTIVEERSMGSAKQYRVDAEICAPGMNRKAKVWIHAIDLGHSIGTPASELIGENGRITDRFREIGESWGYP